MKITNKMNKHIIKQGDLSFELFESGDIFRITNGHKQINLLRGNLIDGQVANIYLRIKDVDELHVKPLIGLKAKTKVQFNDNQVIYQGEVFGIEYQVTLTVLPDRWYYDVLVSKNDKLYEYDLVYGQDVAISDIGGVLSSEPYTAHYIDHAIYSDSNGYTIQSRQNQGEPQFLQLGSLNKVVGYATDGFQVFGRKFKVDGHMSGLDGNLVNEKYQYEFPYLTLQSDILTTKSDEVVSFYGYYEPKHEVFETEKLEVKHNHKPSTKRLSKGFNQYNGLDIELLKVTELDKNYIKTHYKKRRHVELGSKKELLSFFTDNYVHVVTKEKEAIVERNHGHLLISGDLISGTENTMGTTNWMFGVFSSHAVLGNTNLHKLNSDLRNPLNVQTISGLRIYIKENNKLTLLGTPNLYEMGLNYAKWIYNLTDDVITITSHVRLNEFTQRLSFNSKNNKKYDLLMTNQLVLGNHEYEHNINGLVDGNKITFNFDHNEHVKNTYPGLKYQYISHQNVEYNNDSSLFGSEQGMSLLTLNYKNVSEVELDLVATFDKLKPAQLELNNDQAEYIDFIKSLSGIKLDKRKYKEELSQLEDTIMWYTHNALVHYASPHGLEQSNGAAWGTRDVLQGPVELFASSGRYDLVRGIILKVFARQFVENNDFPQWFMFDKYFSIQAHESHGDIIVWPLKVLGDYLEATGDLTILKEKVPFMSMTENKWVDQDRTLEQHIDKTLNAIVNSFVKGTSLPAYGGGDWDDTLQPANQKLTDHMVSGWTPVLLYQGLDSLSKQLEGHPLGRRTNMLKDRLKEDYEKYFLKEGSLAGFIVFEKDHVDYLLHPLDKNTGLKYRLLPLTRSIIAQMVDRQQALHQNDLIDKYLKHPDGVRLMDTFVEYKGGKKTYFQRGETSANIGREIGILYVHAHLRYIEAMAKLGMNENAYEALFTVNPINIEKNVKNAEKRQANMYFSSSDAAFLDRYEAKEYFNKVREGTVKAKGGWRLYSSGPGIYINQLISNVLGVRYNQGDLVIDPMLPKHLKGLKLEHKYHGRELLIDYRNETGDITNVTINGRSMPEFISKLDNNRYRKSGIVINKTILNKINGKLHIVLK